MECIRPGHRQECLCHHAGGDAVGGTVGAAFVAALLWRSADLRLRGLLFLPRLAPRNLKSAGQEPRTPKRGVRATRLSKIFGERRRAERRSARGQRRWPLHATWHGHPARDVHGQDGHATAPVAAPPRGATRFHGEPRRGPMPLAVGETHGNDTPEVLPTPKGLNVVWRCVGRKKVRPLRGRLEPMLVYLLRGFHPRLMN
jgi:hypothetical protein